MELLIYAPGPNLERTMCPPTPGQLTIAVNAAFTRVPYPIDWYCAGDTLAYTYEFTHGKRPRLGWVCKDPTYRRQIQDTHQDFAKLPSWTWDEISKVPFQYSITAAYALARMIGATRVRVFGADQIDDGIRIPAKSDPSKTMMRYSPGRCEVENRERERIVSATGLQIERVLWTA